MSKVKKMNLITKLAIVLLIGSGGYFFMNDAIDNEQHEIVNQFGLQEFMQHVEKLNVM